MWSKLRDYLLPCFPRPGTISTEPASFYRPPPPSFSEWVEYHWNGLFHSIAVRVPSPNLCWLPSAERSTQVYIKTRSKGLARYCLFGHGKATQECDKAPSLSSRPGDEGYTILCLRLRRCGAVELTSDMGPLEWQPDAFAYPEYADGKLLEHMHGLKYIFGWPAPIPTATGGTGATRQPVWVFRSSLFWHGLLDFSAWPNTGHDDGDLLDENGEYPPGMNWVALIPETGGMEAGLRLSSLGDCNTMEAYCEKLKSWGAVYYDDVEACPEAREMRLLESAIPGID